MQWLNCEIGIGLSPLEGLKFFILARQHTYRQIGIGLSPLEGLK